MRMKAIIAMSRFLLGVFFVLIGTCSVSADDDFCGKSKNKKIKKIYEKLMDRETMDRDRFELLRAAIEIDEYCTQCHYDYARLAYYNASKNLKSFDVAKKYYNKTIELCPTYRADAYFSMAMIALQEGDRATALDYMKQFTDFKSEVEDAYSDNHQEKVDYINNMRPDVEYWHKWHNTIVDFKPEVVKNVSSKVDEYLPMLSPDNEFMYFTRKEPLGRVPTGVVETTKDFVEPLYLAYREDVLKEFDSGTKMTKPFDDDQFVGLGGVTISVDNHEMIICGCEMIDADVNGDGRTDPGEQFKNCDLFSTTYDRIYDMKSKKYELKWTSLKRLGDQINTSDGWEATPTLSGDGKTLYFSALRPGKQDIDIYYSNRQEDGSWSRARPVRGINSNGDDKAPFMHADSKTMYFVSGPSKTAENYAQMYNKEYSYDREGAGGFDIYFSKQKDDGTWTTPVLMAKPINTERDELGIIVSTDGHWAYFASNRVAGSQKNDIYRFELYEEAKPEKVRLLKGEVNNEKGEPEADAVVEVKKRGSDEKVTAKVNSDGKYAMIIEEPEGEPEDLVVTVKKEGSAPATQLITKESLKEDDTKNVATVKVEEMVPVKVKVGAQFTIEDILYATASYDLTDKSEFVLDQFVDYLKENPSMKIEIQGHTDNEGNPAKNKTLSQNRANGVMDYLVSKGIEKSRLSAKGFGQEKPKSPNTSAANKAKNRRTEFKVLAM